MTDTTAAASHQAENDDTPADVGHEDFAAQPSTMTGVASSTESTALATAESTTEATAQSTAASAEERPKRGRPRKTTGAKSKPSELVLTVTGRADGTDWSADVVHGTKHVVTGMSVPATAVSAAAKDLHPEIAEAIEAVLSAAREQQQSRVQQLQAELEAAQRALADLQD